ncbi:MAG TPA: peptide-methionine (R)-S-oxide reductase MsrB [Rhodospirillaceae bacterium]|nr:peptide-methionine (R)-S-oxide reductase MsrB [Rhodospirillaceae bacterium]
MTTKRKIEKSEDEWRRQLTPEQYRVARQKGTERPFSGEYESVWTPGIYRCVACAQELFEAADKFDAGCGWPSFTRPVGSDAVEATVDVSHGMRRTEVLCSACGAHLGHVFDDGPRPTGLRYCINSVSLTLDPKKQE